MSSTHFAFSAILAGFRRWLVQHRGICDRTVELHLRYARDLATLFDAAIDVLDAYAVGLPIPRYFAALATDVPLSTSSCRARTVSA
ncbi:MAG: hypothetical protein OXN84_01160 [Albidovulum sp.]|nr:hypothetical protein [Albidovulum sp.]